MAGHREKGNTGGGGPGPSYRTFRKRRLSVANDEKSPCRLPKEWGIEVYRKGGVLARDTRNTRSNKVHSKESHIGRIPHLTQKEMNLWGLERKVRIKGKRFCESKNRGTLPRKSPGNRNQTRGKSDQLTNQWSSQKEAATALHAGGRSDGSGSFRLVVDRGQGKI